MPKITQQHLKLEAPKIKATSIQVKDGGGCPPSVEETEWFSGPHTPSIQRLGRKLYLRRNFHSSNNGEKIFFARRKGEIFLFFLFFETGLRTYKRHWTSIIKLQVQSFINPRNAPREKMSSKILRFSYVQSHDVQRRNDEKSSTGMEPPRSPGTRSRREQSTLATWSMSATGCKPSTKGAGAGAAPLGMNSTPIVLLPLAP